MITVNSIPDSVILTLILKSRVSPLTSRYETDIYRFRCEGRWQMADSRWPVSPALSTDCFSVVFCSVHSYPSSIIIYLSCSSLLKITTEIAHNTSEKVKHKDKDNQLFYTRESSPLEYRQLRPEIWDVIIKRENKSVPWFRRNAGTSVIKNVRDISRRETWDVRMRARMRARMTESGIELTVMFIMIC
jgi:hypothetical protein